MFFNFISGPATITVWLGTNTSCSGTQLGSNMAGFASLVSSISASIGGSTTTHATITVTATMQ